MSRKFLSLVALLFPGFALAGAISGGGGQSVVCRQANDAITSAQSMDLYEGRIVYGLQITPATIPYKDQIKAAVAVLPPVPGGLIDFYASQIQEHMRLTPAGVQLQPINDSLDVLLPPKGCAIEQLANYYNNNDILVNGDIWNALSETDRAALILHEAVYAANRGVGATDSRESRHVVASLFDPSTKWVDTKDQVPKTALICISSAGGLFMWAFKTSDGWNLQFQVLGNTFVVSKKSILVMSPTFDFNEAKNFPILKGDDKIGLYETESGLAKSNFEDQDAIDITRKWEAITDQNGKPVSGYQTPRYYLTWLSETYPKTSLESIPLNCSVEIP